jgi:cell division protein FtsA
MNSLHYGVAPKMKPVSPKRATVVAALDVGTSKIACLVARLKPHAPQEVLRRRSHGMFFAAAVMASRSWASRTRLRAA